jgi:hypothetical protein
MIFPKGPALYENLNTSFAQLDALLGDLRNTQFTGYVHLTAWEYDGSLLLDTGTIVNAVEQVNDQRRYGPSAAEGIAAKGREKDGALNVYRLAPELAQLLANLFNSETLYKDLSSDLTGLAKLLAKLRNEKHTGYIDVRMAKSKSDASIYLRDGQVVDTALSTNDTLNSGIQLLDEIILMTTDEHSLFTVFRADLTHAYSDEMSFADSFARPGMLALWSQVLVRIETTVGNKNGAWVIAFKRACIANATAFPFLDPFAAELEYKDGVVKFTGQASVAQFNAGMSKTLAQAVRELAAQPANKLLMNKLAPIAAQLKTEYGQRLAEVGLTTHLSELFGA